MPVRSDKPPYRVPTMTEIREIPWNGFTAVSTFSGCGGSSLGYQMAGFKVLWASEFVDAARDTYRANAAPHTQVDGRDIRNVTAEDLLAAIGMAPGELDLFDGSPPCASFSTAGKRQAGWGKVKKYSDTEQRTDDLFYEYARLIRGVQPKVFVAENVSGLVKGAAKGYFLRILDALRGCGYQVAAKLLDAQWLGVPQARQRLIFIGVRNDLGVAPAFPAPLPYRYTVRDALPWIDQVGTADMSIAEFKAVDRNPLATLRPADARPAPTIIASLNHFGVGVAIVKAHREVPPETPYPVTHDPETGKDLRIADYAIGREYAKLHQGESSDRYFNPTRASTDAPSPTVTAAGGGVGAAAVTHPTAARKFALGELRRICGFPDDFTLTGTYEQRWERLGRAVPPVMMHHIAATVRDQILMKLEAR